MKVKAVIFRPDRTNDVTIPKMEGKTFRYGGHVYFVHPNAGQVTWVRKLGFKLHYSTYYYVQGAPNPIPIPHLVNVASKTFKMTVEVGKEGQKKEVEFDMAKYPDMVNLGITGDELAALFNPWFYRIIAQGGADNGMRLLLLLLIGTACGVGYIILRMSQGWGS